MGKSSLLRALISIYESPSRTTRLKTISIATSRAHLTANTSTSMAVKGRRILWERERPWPAHCHSFLRPWYQHNFPLEKEHRQNWSCTGSFPVVSSVLVVDGWQMGGFRWVWGGHNWVGYIKPIYLFKTHLTNFF